MITKNKQAIAAAFSRAAKSYNQHDELQRRSAQGLLDLLKVRDFMTVLDAGCGPGSDSLFWRNAGSWVTALDLSIAMIEQARERKAADLYLVADIEALPLLEGKFDLVWSHLAIQWCNSLSQALSGLYRVACPGGKVAFTTLLDNSLYELNQAWLSIDKKPHVNYFLARQVIEDALKPWCYRSHIQTVTLYFNNAQSAMYSLKGIGATYLYYGRSKNILTRRKLQSLEENWPQEETSEYYPLTYYLFHGVIERD